MKMAGLRAKTVCPNPKSSRFRVSDLKFGDFWMFQLNSFVEYVDIITLFSWICIPCAFLSLWRGGKAQTKLGFSSHKVSFSFFCFLLVNLKLGNIFTVRLFEFVECALICWIIDQVLSNQAPILAAMSDNGWII